VILGWTPGHGGRSGTFGALLVGAYDDWKLLWIGQVGTGFTRQTLDRVLEALEPLKRPAPKHEEDARALVQGPPGRQDARGMRVGDPPQ
jgi:bifunctional non-homologous end joining protein LigD